MLQRVDLLLKEKEASKEASVKPKPVATPARAATAAPAIGDTEAKPKAKMHQFGTGAVARAPEPTGAVAPKSKPSAAEAPEPSAAADAPANGAEVVINTTTHKKQYMQMATCLST